MEWSAGRESGPRIGEWLSEACSLFGRSAVVWLAQGALVFLIVAPILAGFFGYYFLVFFRVWADALGPGKLDTPTALSQLYQALAVVVAGVLLVGVLFTWLLSGLVRSAAKQLRGAPVRPADLFSAGDVFWPSVSTALLTSLAIGAGLVLCVVPGLYLAGRLVLAHPLVTERRLGTMAALRESWRLTAPHGWLYLAWALLVYLVIGAGTIVGVGIIATLPLGVLMLMVGYRDAVGLEEEAPGPG